MFFCLLQAYLFDGYWEDIGTIKSFFEANLALTDQVYILADIISSLIFLCQDNNLFIIL
jgi:ADP-glucose pyrophosphorylase